MTEENKQLTVYQKLAKVQEELKAPKNQFNSFGKYNYRSLEDIQEGLKPLLKEVGAVCLLSDTIEQFGDRFYIKAEAIFTDVNEGHQTAIKVTAYARESLTKKGMDDSQITGTASSYARKYAMNGLFAIDDTKDADTDQHTNQVNNAPKQQKPQDPPEVIEARKLFSEVKNANASKEQLAELTTLMKANKVKEFTQQAGFMLAELKEKK